MRVLTAIILIFQVGLVQSEAETLEAAVKKFGDRKYRATRKGADALSTFTLKSRTHKDKNRTEVILESSLTFNVLDTKIIFTQTETTSLDGLRLISSKAATQKSDITKEDSAVIRDGKVHLTSNGQEETIDVVEGVKGELAASWLICAAEQKVGATFKLDVLNMGAGCFEPGHSFRCVGQEEVTLGDKKVASFKWEETGEWKHKEKYGDEVREITTQVKNTYWVGRDGYLVRFTVGEWDAVLDPK